MTLVLSVHRSRAIFIKVCVRFPCGQSGHASEVNLAFLVWIWRRRWCQPDAYRNTYPDNQIMLTCGTPRRDCLLKAFRPHQPVRSLSMCKKADSFDQAPMSLGWRQPSRWFAPSACVQTPRLMRALLCPTLMLLGFQMN